MMADQLTRILYVEDEPDIPMMARPAPNRSVRWP